MQGMNHPYQSTDMPWNITTNGCFCHSGAVKMASVFHTLWMGKFLSVHLAADSFLPVCSIWYIYSSGDSFRTTECFQCSSSHRHFVHLLVSFYDDFRYKWIQRLPTSPSSLICNYLYCRSFDSVLPVTVPYKFYLNRKHSKSLQRNFSMP